MAGVADFSLRTIAALWAVWLSVWCLAAIGAKRARWREPWRTAVMNRLPVLLGTYLLVVPQRPFGFLMQRIVPSWPQAAFCGLLLTVAGLLFAGWARWHLGGNWSGAVTVKRDHTLITSGPYRRVRHPIYTGVVGALLGTALAIGTLRALVGAGLILAGFVIKLHVEEARMRQTFPAEYDAYARHTARLIPGVY
jgi:protein-S-isoprenylcysteine O-methyltransferase Ste14